jgi:septum formation protein
MRLILASTSPRRREILALLHVPFEVIAPEFAEVTADHLTIEKEVVRFAAQKAESVAKIHPQSIVIGSDTMISINSEKIGKPKDHAEAKRILRTLAGKVHRILTSVVIIDPCGGPGLQTVEEVTVRMRRYSETDIDNYLAHDESLDKAGAYSIQGKGRRLIESIQGDYLAAVGLPLKPIADYLRKQGIEVPVNREHLSSVKACFDWKCF